MSDVDTTHKCPRNGCEAQVPEDKLACAPHWFSIPNELRRAVYRTWRSGAGRGTVSHNRAMDAAIRAMNRGPGD